MSFRLIGSLFSVLELFFLDNLLMLGAGDGSLSIDGLNGFLILR
jgi:hypothetical protein